MTVFEAVAERPSILDLIITLFNPMSAIRMESKTYL